MNILLLGYKKEKRILNLKVIGSNVNITNDYSYDDVFMTLIITSIIIATAIFFVLNYFVQENHNNCIKKGIYVCFVMGKLILLVNL